MPAPAPESEPATINTWRGALIAVATSAVREASNADTFLDRVFMATGLEVEVIDTSEESRLTVSAVQQELDELIEKKRPQSISELADLSGGPGTGRAFR